jgi:pimeloyl-ACP methyl ester carboxylesterase
MRVRFVWVSRRLTCMDVIRAWHGGDPDTLLIADDTIAFLEAVVGEPAGLVWHGDGAFAAMLVAM